MRPAPRTDHREGGETDEAPPHDPRREGEVPHRWSPRVSGPGEGLGHAADFDRRYDPPGYDPRPRAQPLHRVAPSRKGPEAYVNPHREPGVPRRRDDPEALSQ